MATDAPTKAELEEFFAANEQRLDHDRQARRIKDKFEPLVKRMTEYVREHGGRDRSTVRHGFVLSLTEKRGTPPYKQEFLRIATPDDQATLDAATPMNESLQVQRVAA